MSAKHKPLRTSHTTVHTTLSNDQLRQLLQIAGEDPRLQDLHDVASIVSYTGLRRGELEILRWSDVEFDNSRFVVHSPKAMSGRYIPFGAKSRQILEALRVRNPEAVFVLGKSPQLVLHRVLLQLRAVARKMGSGPVSLHSLRHSFFRRLLIAGADPSTVMFIGGYRGYSPIKSFLTPAQKCEHATGDLVRLAQI
jgi:integrase